MNSSSLRYAMNSTSPCVLLNLLDFPFGECLENSSKSTSSKNRPHHNSKLFSSSIRQDGERTCQDCQWLSSHCIYAQEMMWLTQNTQRSSYFPLITSLFSWLDQVYVKMRIRGAGTRYLGKRRRRMSRKTADCLKLSQSDE